MRSFRPAFLRILLRLPCCGTLPLIPCLGLACGSDDFAADQGPLTWSSEAEYLFEDAPERDVFFSRPYVRADPERNRVFVLDRPNLQVSVWNPIGVRVTAAEAAAIAERASSSRMTAAAYMRRRALARPVRVTAVHRLAAAERVELQRIGANLNQVARALHSGAVQVPAGTLESVERVADLVADLLTGEGLG